MSMYRSGQENQSFTYGYETNQQLQANFIVLHCMLSSPAGSCLGSSSR